MVLGKRLVFGVEHIGVELKWWETESWKNGVNVSDGCLALPRCMNAARLLTAANHCAGTRLFDTRARNVEVAQSCIIILTTDFCLRKGRGDVLLGGYHK